MSGAIIDYQMKASNYFDRARSDAVALLPRNFDSIIDIGGATGATLSLIRQKYPKAKTICADNHEPSLKVAEERGHIVIKCDIALELPAGIADCDVILCLDVLEHLVDPWTTLRQIWSNMRPGAVIIVSVPNVRHLPISAGLLFGGRWELTDAGVLDRTHLRFFTRRSVVSLLTNAGFKLDTVVGSLGGGRRWDFANLMTFGLLRNLLAVQFLLSGTK